MPIVHPPLTDNLSMPPTAWHGPGMHSDLNLSLNSTRLSLNTFLLLPPSLCHHHRLPYGPLLYQVQTPP